MYPVQALWSTVRVAPIPDSMLSAYELLDVVPTPVPLQLEDLGRLRRNAATRLTEIHSL